MDDGAQVAAHQGHWRGLHGDVGAGAHGDADISGRQGRGVVDAVAGHAHDSAAGFELADQAVLVLRRDAGVKAPDAELAGDVARRAFLVAGEHDHVDAQRLQLRQGLGRAGLHRIADQDRRNGATVDRQEHRGRRGRSRLSRH